MKNPLSPRKVSLSPDKHKWRPSPLPGQIVLVTTQNKSGLVNVAPKSWITMVAFKPPMLLFGCSLKHTTYKNVRFCDQFVINVPGRELANTIYRMPHRRGGRSLAEFGLTAIPSAKILPPRIRECKAHLECKVTRVQKVGKEDDVIVFGEIVALSLNEELVCKEGEDGILEKYVKLSPIFFLEDQIYGVMTVVQKAIRRSG